MTRTLFTAEVTEAQAALLRRVPALSEELDQLALAAPGGTVFDACEAAVVRGGRDAPCFDPINWVTRRRGWLGQR